MLLVTEEYKNESLLLLQWFWTQSGFKIIGAVTEIHFCIPKDSKFHSTDAPVSKYSMTKQQQQKRAWGLHKSDLR